MPGVYIVSDNIVSPLGLTTAANFMQLKNNVAGVQLHENVTMSDVPFYASLFNKEEKFIENNTAKNFTKFEQMLAASISGAMLKSGIGAGDNKTILIISSTKGNISLLETESNTAALHERIALYTSAKLLAQEFGFVNQPLVVSNACISGLLAILTGMRLIKSGQYNHAVIAGADVISKFILSGFQSLQAISDAPCQPFDEARKGINLGEGAATMILSSDPKLSQGIKMMGGSVNNDANHISGPSRTGEELGMAISKALLDAGISAPDIDFISAHGTATIYNDEMEAKAITLAHLQQVPVNSLKGYYGHTLGAAGLIESIIAVHSLKENLVLPTPGYVHNGVSQPLNITTALQPVASKYCLKTASGFGGCNAALVFGKE